MKMIRGYFEKSGSSERRMNGTAKMLLGVAGGPERLIVQDARGAVWRSLSVLLIRSINAYRLTGGTI
jgi:hypothetical protein